MILMTSQSADGTGTGHQLKSPVSIYATGTFGGGTLTIQVAQDVNGSAGTYVDTDVSFTVAGAKNLFIFGTYWVRAVLAGSSSPSLSVATS